MCTGTDFAFQHQHSDEAFFNPTRNVQFPKFKFYMLFTEQIKSKLFNVSVYSLLKPKKVCTHIHTQSTRN